MQILLTIVFYAFVFLVSVMPFRLIYCISDFSAWFMMRVTKYRGDVIIRNLNLVYPNKTEREKQQIMKLFYRNLTDNLLESFKTFTMSKASIVKRHKVVNPELIEELIHKYKGIIGATGHYANWEWGSLSGSLQSDAGFVAFYKPLKNKYLDKVLRNSRSKCGTKLASIRQTSAVFQKYKQKGYVFLMAGDQSPKKGYLLNNSHWLNFLNIETPFLHGIEKHARANDYPVVYIHINRVKRGYYEVKLELLVENPSEYAEGEITRMYANKLQEIIDRKPHDWLWSHDRWKRKKNEVVVNG